MSIIKFIFISLFFIPFLVFAKNGATLPNAGLTPESSFYFLDKLGETLREFFTFNPESKARLQITFAAERVAEIKIILETKGVEAKGLEVAQSRLQANLAKAATIVTDQKSKGKDAAKLAKELDDEFEGPKSALVQSFKEQERTLEAKEDELKKALREAHQTSDSVKEEALAQELGRVKAQKELLELKEEDIEKELEGEEEKWEEAMEARLKAEKAIGEAKEEKQEAIDEAVEEGVELSPNTFAEFDNLLSEAERNLNEGDFVKAKQFAKQAEKFPETVLQKFFASKITYPREDGNGQVWAYFCVPQGVGPFPAVIYNHGGRGDQIGGAPEATCQALAEAGFIGIAPLYTPHIAWSGYIGDIFSTITYLRTHSQVDSSRLAIMGFSRGGAATLETSVFRPNDFKAIILMASGPGENNSLAAHLSYVSKISAPVLIQVAENDRAAPADHLALAKTTHQAFQAAGKTSQLIVYPADGTNGHQMFFELGDYWKDTLAFLESNLSVAPVKTAIVGEDAIHKELKQLKQEVNNFHKHSIPTKEHYHRIEKDLVRLEQGGAPAEELVAIRQLLEPWNPSAMTESDRTRQATAEEQKKREASQVDYVLPPGLGCRNDRPVLTHDFTDFSKIRQITAPGSPSAEGPKGHAFIWTGGERVPVYVPTHAVLRAGTFGLQDGVPHYTLIFQVKGSCSFELRLAHITEPIQSIKNVLPQTPPADSRDIPVTTELDFPAGFLVGHTVGNVPSGNWDFGWYDTVKEGPLASHGSFGRHRYGLCWADYYSPEKQPLYRALLTGPKMVCTY